MFKKIINFKNYLAYQIFISFMITIAIVFAIAILIPHFDARVFNPIEQSTRVLLQQETHYVEKHHHVDEVFNKKISLISPKQYNVIIFEPQSEQIVGLPKDQIHTLQAFMFRANDPLHPLQRRFGQTEYYGPFPITATEQNYYLYFTKIVPPQRAFINYVFDSQWIMIFIFMVISTPIMLWLSHRIAKPVKKLRITANAVATGNLTIDPSLEQESILEIRQMGKSFNQMISALQRLTSYQQRLLSDISHELKTPLTRMQLTLSLLRRRNGEMSEITRLEGEIQKLDKMIHDLLLLSRNQTNHHLKREILPIHKIWEEVLEDAQFELEQSGIDLFVSKRILHSERYFINGNLSMLASALENVIRNAKKYTKDTVKVMIYIDKKHLYLLIDDNGAGVPVHLYEEIFRPFYRVEEDRARQTGGTGLGLAIVANAIQQHQGSVLAKQSPLGGLRIEIKLPLWFE